jgi:PAS domain S-box-containing protein
MTNQMLMAETTAPPREVPGAEASTRMALALRNLQHAVTQSHDAIFMMDGAGIVSRVNPAFEKLTGYSSVEAVGKDLSSLIAGGPQAGDYRRIWGRIFSHQPFSGEVELQPKSGPAWSVDLVVSPVLDNRGQITGLVCNCADRTGKTIQSAPAAADAAPTPEGRGIGEFAHALNNLLLPVIANAELTLEALPSDSPLRSRLRVIKSGAHRASDLVREQLDLARLPRDMMSSSGAAASDPLSPVFGHHAAAVAEVLSSTSCERHRTGPATLLIVEDESLMRESMTEFLSRSGYNVLSAGSAEEALEASKSHSEIDLVITDVVLPQMSGQQLAGKLTTAYPEMKVLFVSGYSQSAVFHRDVPSLNRAFLQKPFSLPVLAEKVGGVLGAPKKALAAAAAGL